MAQLRSAPRLASWIAPTLTDIRLQIERIVVAVPNRVLDGIDYALGTSGPEGFLPVNAGGIRYHTGLQDHRRSRQTPQFHNVRLTITIEQVTLATCGSVPHLASGEIAARAI